MGTGAVGAEVTKRKEAGTIDYYQFCFNQDGSTLILLDKFKVLHPVSNKSTQHGYSEVIIPVITYYIATSTSPLGPYTKAANNPLLEKNTDRGGFITGTGHNSIAYSPDGKDMFCVYHARTDKTGDERVVCIDRMQVKNGKITILGPTTTPKNSPQA